MSAIAPIADKLGKLVRMLASDHDAEIVAAARAIVRTLADNKIDIRALADGPIANGHKKFSEQDALEIYQRGVEDGRREGERSGRFPQRRRAAMA